MHPARKVAHRLLLSAWVVLDERYKIQQRVLNLVCQSVEAFRPGVEHTDVQVLPVTPADPGIALGNVWLLWVVLSVDLVQLLHRGGEVQQETVRLNRERLHYGSSVYRSQVPFSPP